MTIEDKAKLAAQSRAELQRALETCAVIIAETAHRLTAAATELATSTENERVASLSYVAELEQQLARARGELRQ